MRFSTVVVFAFVVVLSVVSGALSDRASRYSARGFQQDAAGAAAQAQQGRSLEAKAAGYQHESQEHAAGAAAAAAGAAQQGRAAGARSAGQGGRAAALGTGTNQDQARLRGLNMPVNHEMTEAMKMFARGVSKIAREIMAEPAN